MDREARLARSASKKALAAIGALLVVEIYVGLAFNSIALIADGLDKALDIVGSLVVFLGLMFAPRPADATHPYGHAKIESLTSLVIALLLFVTAFGVTLEAARRFYTAEEVHGSAVTIVVAIASIAISAGLAKYKIDVGRKTRSTSLVADGYNSRSDAYQAGAVLVGLVAVSFGFPLGDPIAAMVIVGLLLKTGIDVLRGAYPALLDVSPGKEFVNRVQEIASTVDGVRSTHKIRARTVGRGVQIDMHIIVSGHIAIEEAHDIAHQVEAKLKAHLPEIESLLIHTEPPEP